MRARIQAWLRYVMRTGGWSARAFARNMGVAGPTVTNVLNGVTGSGLDFAVRLHRATGISLDTLVDTDPPLTPRNA